MKPEQIIIDIQNSPIHATWYKKSESAPVVGVFTGYTGSSSTYHTLAKALLPHFEVLVFQNRDHGENNEIFDPQLHKRDFYEIQKQHRMDIVVPHSFGASVDTNIPTFLINPFWGPGYISGSSKASLAAAKKIVKVPFIKNIFNRELPKRIKVLDYNTTTLMDNTVKLQEVVPPQLDGDIAFMLCGKDTVIGTNKEAFKDDLTNRIYELYPEAANYSAVGEHLNHNLNTKGDNIVFDKESNPKREVVASIVDFYNATVLSDFK